MLQQPKYQFADKRVEPDWSKLEYVEKVARALWDAGFAPVAFEDDPDDPEIELASTPEKMIAEMHALYDEVISWGFEDGEFLVESLATSDGQAFLYLVDLNDLDVEDPS